MGKLTLYHGTSNIIPIIETGELLCIAALEGQSEEETKEEYENVVNRLAKIVKEYYTTIPFHFNHMS